MLVKAAVLTLSTLAGLLFGYWLGNVYFVSLSNPAPNLPDWFCAMPYALALISGFICPLLVRALMRRITPLPRKD